MKLPLYSTCVNWPQGKLEVLGFIIDEGEEITRDTLLKKADVEDPDEAMPDWDYHIGYYKVSGWPIYYFVHSAIEHVFATEKSIEELMDALDELPEE